MNFTAHMIVKNEDQWVFYALEAILPCATKVIIFDNGSVDKTAKIIQEIKSPKIHFEKKLGEGVDLADLREEQVRMTKTEWFLIVDGDEIWPEDQLKILLKDGEAASKNIVGVYNWTKNCVGDVFHFLPFESGGYKIGDKRGNLNIRLIKKTDDLKVVGRYPLESYCNGNGPLEKQDKNLLFSDCWYLHTTFLKRSSKVKTKTSGSFGKNKIWERGDTLEKSKLPGVFFKSRSGNLPDPLYKRGIVYEVASRLTTPVIKLKRSIS